VRLSPMKRKCSNLVGRFDDMEQICRTVVSVNTYQAYSLGLAP